MFKLDCFECVFLIVKIYLYIVKCVYVVLLNSFMVFKDFYFENKIMYLEYYIDGCFSMVNIYSFYLLFFGCVNSF